MKNGFGTQAGNHVRDVIVITFGYAAGEDDGVAVIECRGKLPFAPCENRSVDNGSDRGTGQDSFVEKSPDP